MGKQPKAKSYKLTPQEYRAILKDVELEEVMLDEASAKIHRDKIDKSLEISIDEKITHEIHGDTVVSVHHFYTLTAPPGSKRDFFLKLTCAFELKYSAKTTLSESFMEIFKDTNIPLNTWPYFREFAQSMTQRMNIPPLTLPLRK